jgi:glucan 1,3-beta-glucosidase
MSDKQRDLEHHWDTWVGEEDLKWLCEKGVNTVRLPVCLPSPLILLLSWPRRWLSPGSRFNRFGLRTVFSTG